jgi:DNA-binding transcriptional LysR family regulator
VQHGLGLAFVSRLAVAAELAAGLFQIVELPGTPVKRTLHALRLRSVTPSTAVQALLTLLQQTHR